MPNAWCRLYAEFASDPKVQSMSEAMQRRLVMLFCAECCDMLCSADEPTLAFYLRISEDELAETKALFIAKGFIDVTGCDGCDKNVTWRVRHWNKRQFISDSSADRTRRWRRRVRTSQERHGDVTVTGPDTDTDTETETERELTLSSPKATSERPKPQDFFNTWNTLCDGLPKAQELTDDRLRKIRTRIKQGLRLERFSEAVRCCTQKPFLRGEGERGWQATFDWLMKNSTNIENAITGYNSHKPPARQKPSETDYHSGWGLPTESRVKP
jgi:hypothetical protein